MKSKEKLILIGLALLFAFCFSFNLYFSIPYYKADSVRFQNLDNEQLSARYAESKNGKGVMIASDLAHDKSELTTMVYELTKLGYGVYVFDFPSQGGSAGNIPFHMNSMNYLAEQFYCAMVSYSQLANMNVSNIHVIGYGSGARAVLQTAALGYIRPASMTLIGTDVNLTEKIQYNVMNFNKDSEEDWIKGLNAAEPGVPIHLITSNLDNISTNADNEVLKTLLTRSLGVQADANNTVTLSSVPFVVHYMQMNSVRIARTAVFAIAQADGLTYQSSFLLFLRTPVLILMFATLSAGCYFIGLQIREKRAANYGISVKLPRHYIRNKFIMWFPTALVSVLLPIALYLLPIHFPYNDIFRLSIFVSYGIVMTFLYKFSTFGDNLGRVMFLKDGKAGLRDGLLFFALMLLALSAVSFSGMTFLYSIEAKWVWVVIFSVLCFCMFYVDEKERKFAPNIKNTQRLLLLCNYLPLLAAPVVLLAFGLFNTAFMVLLMLAQLVFVLSFEFVLVPLGTSTRVNALIKAVIFQMLVFAQCTMFFNIL